MPGYQKPFLGEQPQMGQQGQQGAPPPRQGPPQQGPGMGGQGPASPQGNPAAMFNFAASPGGMPQNRYAGRQKYQGAIDDLMRQLQFAQIQGANPMVIADLQMQLQQQQRAFGEWQNSEYANQMAQYTRPGLGGVGQNAPASPGHSQLQQNPFLEMLLMNQLGMGGGPAGGRGGQQIG